MLPAQLFSNVLGIAATVLITSIFCISEIDSHENIYTQIKSVAVQHNENSNTPISIIACENTKLQVKCEEGKVIHVLESNYGRTSLDACNPDNNQDWRVDCRNKWSGEHVLQTCHGRQNCEISASNTWLGDSCPGTIKYLEMQYLCEAPGKDKFRCSSGFGNFLHATYCKLYYNCILFMKTLWPCPYSQLFDEVSRQCKPAEEVDCGSRKRPPGFKSTDIPKTVGTTPIGYESTASPKTHGTTPKGYETTSPTKTDGTTPKGDGEFTCPGMFGYFMHTTDCEKYYGCTFFRPSVGTCPVGKLFDGVKKRCKPANEVHCGSRTRPIGYDTTTSPKTVGTTPEDSTIIAETTTELTTVQPTTTTTPIVTVITTTTKPRVTAPGTDCDEDDLDCIIKDLGKNPDWFECEADMGSYPHPASRKLFIFCMNWKPSVKKCAKNFVFSKQQMTCVPA